MKETDIDGFMDFCKTLEGRVLSTEGRGREFRLEEVKPYGLLVRPLSTGRERWLSRADIEDVHRRFAETESLHPKDYGDITWNASYHLTLLRRYLEKVGGGGEDGQAPAPQAYIVDARGQRRAVVLSQKEYSKLLQKIEDLEDALALNEAVEEGGQFRDAEEFFEELLGAKQQ